MVQSPPKLGDLLVSQGLVTPEQVSQALANQLKQGGRVGTNLVELEALPLDKVGEALGQQHGIPVATTADLEAAGPALRLLRRDYCAAKGIIPLRLEQGVLHVAMLDPRLVGELERFASPQGIRVQAYAVPQLRLLYFLERHYDVPRAKRYLRMRSPQDKEDVRRRYLTPTVPPAAVGGTGGGIPARSTERSQSVYAIGRGGSGMTGPHAPAQRDAPPPAAAEPDEVAGPDAAPAAPAAYAPAPAAYAPAAPAPAQAAYAPAQAAYAPAAPKPRPPSPSDELVYLDQLTPQSVPERARASDFDLDVEMTFDEADPRVNRDPAQTLDEALAALRRAGSRDDVVRALVRPIFAETTLNVVLLVRGDLAVAITAWGTEVSPHTAGGLVLPLDMDSLLKQAIDTRQVVRTPASDDELQYVIADHMQVADATEVCVLPVTAHGEVTNLVCAHSVAGFPADAQRDLARLAAAASAAYARLLSNLG